MNAKTQEPAEAPTSGLDALKGSMTALAHAFGERAVDTVASKAGSVTKRLTDYAEGGGGPATSAVAAGTKTLAEGGSKLKAGVAGATAAVKDKAQDVIGGLTPGSGSSSKFINFVEAIDVGAPVDVVYNAWTEYDRWPDFMRKLESAHLDEEEGKISFEGKVFLSHRRWEATIVDQIAARRVVWESTGEKGSLSGAITFHPLADDLTRIVVVVDYHPRGFVEKFANMWRPVGRRMRLELKLFVHHVMTDAVLNPEELEGYRAEIQDEEVVRSHSEVVQEEGENQEADDQDREGEDEDTEGEDTESEDSQSQDEEEER